MKKKDNITINNVEIKSCVVYAFNGKEGKCLIEFPDSETTEYYWLYGYKNGFGDDGYIASDVEYVDGGMIVDTFRPANKDEIIEYVNSHPLYKRMKENLWWIEQDFCGTYNPDFTDVQTRRMFWWFLNKCKKELCDE